MNLILALGMIGVTTAAPLTMTFSSINTPPNANTSVPNPWNESLMTLSCFQVSSNNPTSMVIRRFSSSDTGIKSVSAQFVTARFVLTARSGSPFKMNSIELFPINGGGSTSSSVTFTGKKTATAGGGNVTVTLTTGTSLNGLVHSFPANFTELDELTWTVNNNQPGFGYHQFDNIEVELPNIVTVPEDITLSEGSGPIDLHLQRDPDATGTLGFTPSLAGTATSGIDYQVSSLAFTFNASTNSIPFTVEALLDNLNESPETIIIQWPSSPSYNPTRETTTVTLGDTNGVGFPDYMAGHGLIGNEALPEADPNDDGITNLEAYTFRLNPAGPWPAAWRDRLPRFTTRAVGGFARPAITWQIPAPIPSDVRFTVTESSALTNWNTVAQRNGYGLGSLWSGATGSAVSDSGSPRIVIVPGTQPITGPDKSFLRLGLEYVSSGGGAN